MACSILGATVLCVNVEKGGTLQTYNDWPQRSISALHKMVTRPHVLIVGAGLAGLTLAQSLRKQCIPFDIFERDASIDAHAGGWAIAIHTCVALADRAQRGTANPC